MTRRNYRSRALSVAVLMVTPCKRGAVYVAVGAVLSAALWAHIYWEPVADEPPKCKARVRPHVCSLTADDRHCGLRVLPKSG